MSKSKSESNVTPYPLTKVVDKEKPLLKGIWLYELVQCFSEERNARFPSPRD